MEQVQVKEQEEQNNDLILGRPIHFWSFVNKLWFCMQACVCLKKISPVQMCRKDVAVC